MLLQILYFLFVFCQAFAVDKKIFHLADIEKEIQHPETTLVVFDVDEVLITTEDQFIHPYAWDLTYTIANRFKSQLTDPDEIDQFLSLCYLLPRRILIESETPSFIQKLQSKGVKVIGLTACQTGKLGKIEKVENWRADDLDSFGIDFSPSFPDAKSLVLKKLQSPKDPSPLFMKGILFSKGFKKGEVLQTFLEEVGFKPSKIIFIDDLQENLLSVKATLEKMKVPHVVIEYTGASRHFKPLDKDLVEFQLTHLFHHQEWMNDAQAKTKISAQ